jgi:ATP-dependent RNA helicase DeaD
VQSGAAEETIARLLSRSAVLGPAPRDVRVLAPAAPSARPSRAPHPGAPRTADGAWVTFRVSYGGAHGADPRRILAMICRRGDVRKDVVGAIRVERQYSLVRITEDAAPHFAESAGRRDPRDPRVRIERAA